MNRPTHDTLASSEYNILEAIIRRVGKTLLDRSTGSSPVLFNHRRWANTLLDWCMKDEAFKVRLFRFVDVLPSLTNDSQVAKLIEEYFGDLPSLAGPLQWGLRAMSATALGARLSAHSLRHQILQMATLFIAGTSVLEAGPVLAQLWNDRRACSIDLLGEASVSELEADRYRDRCLEALTLLGRETAAWPFKRVLEQDHLGTIPRVQLSVKLSALYSQLDAVDPEGAYHALAGRLRPLLDVAKTLPAALTFDMEQAETKNILLMTFMRLLSEDSYRAYPHAGIALQAYTRESAADLARLIEWVRQRRTPVGVRLVKGAYWDSEIIRYRQRGWPVPVFETKEETDANYERLTRTLIQHIDVIRPAFGTHNLRSLAHAEAAAQAAHVPPEACEYQMIFGMAEPLQTAVAEFGRRVRIYTPVGELIPGMAYLVRRLLENTSNESFLRREYSEKEPLDRLLDAPTVLASAVAIDRHDGSPGARRSDVADRFLNEPHTDFSQDAARTAMQDALSRVKGRLGRPVSLAPGSTPSGHAMLSRNPSNPDEVVGRFHACALKEVPHAMAAARKSAAKWSTVPPDHRAAMLDKTASLMRDRRFDLAAWEIFETGKPWREADADVAEAIDFLGFYAQEMRRLSLGRRLGHAPGELNEVLYAPRGVAVVIAPWNFPLAIPTGMIAAALVTGNTVLFKPSERSSVLGLLLTRLLHESGVPPDVLQVLPGGPEIGQALAAYSDVDLIAFTGSKTVGLQLLAHSSQVTTGQRRVTRVIAEMGGKNAIIIDETADLDEAVIGVVTSFTGYQGQKCSACSRAIVHESIYDLFLQRLTEAVASLHIGPPENPTNVIGPMIDARALAKVQDYIEVGRQEGRLIVAGRRLEPGYFITPTIVADIQPHHRTAQEEIFGPLLAVMKARDFVEALAIANDSPYALTGGVYSRSPAHIQKARTMFDVGNLYINRPITGALVGRQPFGGHRLSGVGNKAGGEEYLGQFLITRVVSENTLRRGFAPSEWKQ